MSNQLDSAVAYDGLPIGSGGAHGLGRLAPREALDALRRFLASCAQPLLLTSYFDLPFTPELTVSAWVAAAIEGRFPKVGVHHPVAPSEIDDAIALLESISPQPRNPWGMSPVWLSVVADVRLLSPVGGGIWPGQDPSLFGDFRTPGGVRLGASQLRLILESKAKLGLSLSIPQATDADVAIIVPWLQKHLPCRLSDKQWTRWSLTKNGRTYRGQRISPSSISA
jgi:hypothetical protein